MQEQYAYVIVDIMHEKVDRPFLYRIPQELYGQVKEGVCVYIPFGRSNKRMKGYVVSLTDTPDWEPDKIKNILEVSRTDTSVEGKMIRLAYWIKKHYGSTMIQALKTVLPAKQTVKNQVKRQVRLLLSEEEAGVCYAECVKKHKTAQARLLQELLRCEEIPYELVTGKLHVARSTILTMQRQGILDIREEVQYRRPAVPKIIESSQKKLSSGQEEIVRKVTQDYDSGQPGTYLIHGITGSGKTQVYISLIAEMLKRGKQAVVLIPEIALTYQTVMRFYECFGDRVSILNSTLSAGEKYDQCERAKRREIDVIIGPRSALFTPFPELGMIIMDEEHETSYKSESSPKYYARETAEELARIHKAALVLGSATPSLEAYYRAKCGTYQLFTLKERLTGGTLPEVYTVDLREELKQGNRSIFSLKLQELMEDRLQKKQQIMLFLNRRGYAGFISCRACGLVMKCPHCEVSLSEHKNGMLVCHYCGYEERKPALCPKCGSKYISGFKAGTQQIEEKLKMLYPKARVLRMDADTTKNKDSYEAILSAFANREADVLIGTQMIVKGHDFPNVTLVGVLAADLSLAAADYRSGERTFQLLTQAAGRAGRGEVPGEVVIQTYQPEHYSITYAAAQDYEGFYEEEILYRQMLHYPPVCHMLAVQIFASDSKRGQCLAEMLAGQVREKEKEVQVMGPSKAALEKIQDIFRFVFYVKQKNYDKLIEIKDTLEESVRKLQLKNETVQFDFDPMNLF